MTDQLPIRAIIRASAVILITLLATVTNARGQMDQAWRDDASGCSLVLPPGWVVATPIRQHEIQEQYRAHTGTDPKIVGIRAVIEKPSDPQIYILVQLYPVPPSARTYEHIEQLFGVATANDPGLPKPIAHRNISDASQPLGTLDRSANRFTIRVHRDDLSPDAMDSVSFGHVGATHMVLLACFARHDNIDTKLADFDAVSRSLRFDKGRTFPPQLGASVATPLRVGGLAGLLGVGAFALSRLWRRK